MKVAIVGATGETGQYIVQGLLESPESFEVVALSRPASIDSPRNQALREAGVQVIPGDITGSEEDLTEALQGVDVLLAALSIEHFDNQRTLANAAKKAGVKRFVPSNWATAAPRGVSYIHDEKWKIFDHIKAIGLGYTIIEVGWWYQIDMPRLPSGRARDFFATMPPNLSPVGPGNIPCASSDSADIGRWVARIIADPRTLNQLVLAYGDVLTQDKVWETVERVTGEKPERNPASAEDIATMIAERKPKAEAPDAGFMDRIALIQAEYMQSIHVRGDNDPEKAKERGYLLARELYPDVKVKTFEEWVQALLDGQVKSVYAAKQHLFKAQQD